MQCTIFICTPSVVKINCIVFLKPLTTQLIIYSQMLILAMINLIRNVGVLSQFLGNIYQLDVYMFPAATVIVLIMCPSYVIISAAAFHIVL